MTLQVVYSVSAGVTQDLSTQVFMASERLGLPPFSITQNAEEGSVGMSSLVVDDPLGTQVLKGHRRIYFVETSAPAGSQVIGNTYVGAKTIDRGDWVVGPLARTYTVNLADANTLIGRRIVVGSDGNRPAETDVQRVQWLLTTTEANEFNGSSTYVNTAGGIAMDAVDYRGQSVENILNDCSQASGKNYWVIYEEALGEFSLWYDFDYSATYDSALLLSNDEADIDDSTTFAYFPTSPLTQDPGRVYSGTYLPYDGGWVYEQMTATGDEFVFRDVAYPSFNVKSEAKARARAVRYNTGSSTEEDVFKVSFVVPAASVNGLMHGMRIQIKGTHWGFTGGNDYTAFTQTRCLNRTVTQLSSTHYRIDAELSPVNMVTPRAVIYRARTDARGDTLDTTQPIAWTTRGDDAVAIDELNVPTVGPITAFAFSTPFSGYANWGGWDFAGSGTIDLVMRCEVFAAIHDEVNTIEALVNGVVVASASGSTPEDFGHLEITVTATISITNGDRLTGQFTGGDYLDKFQIEITGGSLSSQ